MACCSWLWVGTYTTYSMCPLWFKKNSPKKKSMFKCTSEKSIIIITLCSLYCSSSCKKNCEKQANNSQGHICISFRISLQISMSLILGSIRPLTQMPWESAPTKIKHHNIIPRIKVPNMLKAHGDAKTFEICQVRLNIEGITWDWGFQAAANTIKHPSLKKKQLHWWCFWVSLRPSLSNLHSSEEKFILIMQANDAPQTSSPEMSWWLCAKKQSNIIKPSTCNALQGMFERGACALLPILMQQCMKTISIASIKKKHR